MPADQQHMQLEGGGGVLHGVELWICATAGHAAHGPWQ